MDESVEERKTGKKKEEASAFTGAGEQVWGPEKNE